MKTTLIDCLYKFLTKNKSVCLIVQYLFNVGIAPLCSLFSAWRAVLFTNPRSQLAYLPRVQIAGQILLTDTYGRNTKSFITIPISEELTREFIIQRQRATACASCWLQAWKDNVSRAFTLVHIWLAFNHENFS